ncbi:hypothetical protein LPJ61_001412 [Coemansia biformis]|uniref:Importin N-terminal domain-containing protein n=1 Tax=Coemansia biformis TaxID=1286918 RepID=A0A9W8CY48_9FUNG|nr:hypothetical protein LPJ61_001412 [Coemansia biformis]
MDDRQAAVGVLEAALSQDPACVAQAEERLAVLATRPNFHAFLFDIFADRSVPSQVRWMAIISLKNGIDKYWKRSAQYPIRISEKELVRPRLLTLLDEDNPLIALQYCVAVAKIARWEYPRVWPGFAEELLAQISAVAADQSAPAARRSAMEHNALHMLHLFVKSLSARTLPLERQKMRELTPLVFAVLVPIYEQRLDQFHAVLMQAGAQLAHDAGFFAETLPLLRSIRFCVKVLRRLWVFGYEKIESADSTAQGFFVATIGHQPAFYDVYRGLAESTAGVASDEYLLVLRKIVLLYGKLYLDFQKYHAVQFITVPCTKNMLHWYWQQISSEAPRLVVPLAAADSDADSDAPEPTLEPLLIQGLVLYKNVAKNYFYQPEDSDGPDSDSRRCRQIIDDEVLTPAFVAQMAETLMLRYIPLKPRDLERWQDDPEGWLADEDSDYWNFEVRRCAEHLFVDLVSQNRARLAPELAALVLQSDAVDGALSPTELHYRRDGRYAALGLCAVDLYDHVDFCQWLKQHPAVDSPMGAVKWRMAWLVGKWVTVKFPADQRPRAYALLLGLAGASEPLIVRMEALSSLKCCVNDWDFAAEQFAPFMQLAIERIAELLAAVATPECRMRAVNFLSSLVQHMQREIVPYAASIVRLIPPLWDSATGENMYQTAILVLITKLVEALGAQSTELQAFVAPLIRHSVNLDDPAHVYLMEDGIELWLVLVRSATGLDASILALLPLAAQLIQCSTESLRRVLKIIEGYLLIDGARVYLEGGPAIVDALHTLVADASLTARATAAGYNTLGLLVQCMPAETSSRALLESNVLWTAFTCVVDKREAAPVLVHHAGFLARTALQYPVLFREFLSAQNADVAHAFAENWVELYYNVTDVARRRLLALGFATAIVTTNDGILKALPVMVPVWNEIMSDTGASLAHLSDVGDDDDDFSNNCGEVMVAENERRKRLLAADPAHKLDARLEFARSMEGCEALNGADRFQAILAQVGGSDLEDFKNQLG